MNEDLITEELARLLPDIKFNIETHDFYTNNLGLCYFPDDWCLISEIKGMMYDYEESDIGIKYYAPTLSVLQQWLMKNHNIYVLCSLDETTEPKFVYSIKHYKNNTFINVPKYQYSDLYYTYNQCLNDGLLEAVKYIKNERNIN